MSSDRTATAARVALVLTGGGARGAYQAGVVEAVHEIAARLGVARPFQTLTGVSAGAINASFLAAQADAPFEAAARLAGFWRSLQSDMIFRTDAASIGRIGLRWITEMVATGNIGRHQARALLDTAPLRGLLRKRIPFRRIRGNLDAGHLDGLAVAATDVESSENITFCMVRDEFVPWTRSFRLGVPAVIGEAHVAASAAIPLLFPPIEIGGRPFGDGCLRHAAPLSAALHLGASKLLVVGVRKGYEPDAAASFLAGRPAPAPSLARILSLVIHAVMLEAVDVDIERLRRINATIRLIPEAQRAQTPLREVECLYLRPSEDVGQIAAEESKHAPRIIRYLLRGLGPVEEAAGIASYLLFEPGYCGRLIELGRRDTLARQDEVEAFLQR